MSTTRLSVIPDPFCCLLLALWDAPQLWMAWVFPDDFMLLRARLLQEGKDFLALRHLQQGQLLDYWVLTDFDAQREQQSFETGEVVAAAAARLIADLSWRGVQVSPGWQALMGRK